MLLVTFRKIWKNYVAELAAGIDASASMTCGDQSSSVLKLIVILAQ